MENKKSVWPVAFRWGVIMGLISIAFNIIIYLIFPIDPETLQPKGGWINTMVSLVIMGVILYMGAKSYRDQENEGLLSYGKSLGFMMAMSVPAAVMMLVYLFAFFTWIDPELIGKIAEKQYESMAERGMSDEQIEKSMGMMSSMNSPIVYSIFGSLGTVLQVLIVGLIVSIFTRKEPAAQAE